MMTPTPGDELTALWYWTGGPRCQRRRPSSLAPPRNEAHADAEAAEAGAGTALAKATQVDFSDVRKWGVGR